MVEPVVDDDVQVLRSRLRASLAELDAARLQHRFAGLGLTRIGHAPERQPIRVGGEISGARMSGYEDAPSVRVLFTDGTGTAVALFTGRRRLRGLEVGRAMLVEGVGRREADQLLIRNPAYRLVP